MAELPAADLMRWLGVNKVSLADLAKRGIVQRGKKTRHLRRGSLGRGLLRPPTLDCRWQGRRGCTKSEWMRRLARFSKTRRRERHPD